MEHCDIVKDLLPLCADGLASTESEELVRRHTERCPECRALLERMRAPLTGTPEPDGRQRAERLCGPTGAKKAALCSWRLFLPWPAVPPFVSSSCGAGESSVS